MRSVFVHRPGRGEAMRRTSGWQGGLRVWLPVAVALLVIMLESTKTFSAANTSSWLRPVFERYLGPISDRAWATAHHVMRKSGHFCGYGMVCVTFLRAWLLTLARRAEMTSMQWRWWASVLAVCSTAVVASLDELHQSFLPSRTGQVSDVLLDTSGAVTVAGLIWLVALWLRRRAGGAAVVAV